MKKITPWLWFDNEAEEAATFYTSIFQNSRILDVQRYGKAGPKPEGTVMTPSSRRPSACAACSAISPRRR